MAADTIRAVAVTPTFARIGVLAVITVTDTSSGLLLELEISRRWPRHEQCLSAGAH